jgi:hypothetical protein
MQIEREHGEGRLRVPTGTNSVIAGEVPPPPPTPRWFEGKERRWTPERTRWRYMVGGSTILWACTNSLEFRLALFLEI